MNTAFTLEVLQENIGKEYVEANPITNRPRIVQGLNEVWAKLDEHGGVGQVAKVFGLDESQVWSWVDSHQVPELYLRYLLDPGQSAGDVQLSSVGYEDPVSGECWPESWKLEVA